MLQAAPRIGSGTMVTDTFRRAAAHLSERTL